MQKKVGIIGAMDVEVEVLKSGLNPLPGQSCVQKTTAGGLEFAQGLLDGVEVVVVKSGVGKVNAALCAQRLAIQFGVTHIINSGIAGAMGAEAYVLEKREDVESVLKKALAAKGPVLIDCRIDKDDKVFPMVPAGRGLMEVFDGEDYGK